MAYQCIFFSWNYETITLDSDEASRIFQSYLVAQYSPNTDSYLLLAAQLFHNLSFMSSFSSFDGIDKSSASVPSSTFEYATTDMGLSIDDETGAQKSKTSSIIWECESRYRNTYSVSESNNQFTEKAVDNSYSMNNICTVWSLLSYEKLR